LNEPDTGSPGNGPDIIHALKEVDAQAMAWAQTPQQVIEILQYVVNAK
jgi:hypothetical protein